MPRAIPPFDPQEFVPSEKSVETTPSPGLAEAVTEEVEAAGDVVLNPAGNAQLANDNPQIGAGAVGALPTVNESLAKFPVFNEPIKRFVEVLLYVPTTGTVTLTLIVQLLFAESVPLEKEREVAPALGAKVGVPQLDVDALGVAATTMAPGDVGRMSVKFNPLIVPVVGLVSVKVRVDMPPTLVGSGLKFFAMVTEAGSRMFAMRVEMPKSAL